MDLFNTEIDKTKNLLPEDGVVNYYGKLFTTQEAAYYLERLLKNIDWRNDEVIIFGKRIITKRKVGWYGDRNFEYTYSNLIPVYSIYIMTVAKGWPGIAMLKKFCKRMAPLRL
jgi:alkylated DNA repair dioxygenase AlkB